MYLLHEATERLPAKFGQFELGIKAVEIVGFDGKAAHLREIDGREWRLVEPEPICLGLVCVLPLSETIKQFCDWWRDESGEAIITFNISCSNTIEYNKHFLDSWITCRLLSVIDSITSENRDLFKQNSQLRRAYSALQSTFSQLETHIDKHRLQTPILQFETRQIASFWQPETPLATLRQTLPILASRLSYLELSFRPAIKASNGELHFTLRVEPSGAILSEWRVSYGDIRLGWNGFSCPAIIDDPNEVILECLWSTHVGAPAVGLSEPHWDFPYGAVGAQAGDQAQTLAMRLWSALPGVRPSSVLPAINRGSASEGRLVALGPSELAHARQYEFAETGERSYPSVAYIDNCARLKVHPHKGVPTIAELPNPLPEGVTYVSADARTIRAEAPDIEYSMLVAPPNIAPEALLAEVNGPAVGFSGWFRLKALECRRLSVILDKPTDFSQRLFLATRLPAGEIEDYGWATWGGIEVGSGWIPAYASALIAGDQETDAPKADAPSENEVTCPAAISEAGIAAHLGMPQRAMPADSRANHANSSRDAGDMRIALTKDVLAKAAQIWMHPKIDYGYESVRFLDDYNALLVHPHTGQETIARVSLPDGTIGVSASCQTIFAEARAVDYAMYVVPAKPSGVAVSGFSGWHTIEPTVRNRISLTLADPTEGANLYMVTRLPQGVDESYAWATWSDINCDISQLQAGVLDASPSLTATTPSSSESKSYHSIGNPSVDIPRSQLQNPPRAGFLSFKR